MSVADGVIGRACVARTLTAMCGRSCGLEGKHWGHLLTKPQPCTHFLEIR